MPIIMPISQSWSATEWHFVFVNYGKFAAGSILTLSICRGKVLSRRSDHYIELPWHIWVPTFRSGRRDILGKAVKTF